MKNLELFEVSREHLVNANYESVEHVLFARNFIYLIKNQTILQYDQVGNKVAIIGTNFTNVKQFEYLYTDHYLWIGLESHFNYVQLYKNNNLNEIKHYTTDNSTVIPLFTIETAVWNPTHDSIVIAKPNGEIGLYTPDYNSNILIEVKTCNLRTENLECPVPLGWGSAERQYRSEIEHAEKEQLEGEIPIKPDGNVKTQVSWRGNGEMFVVSYDDSGQRKIKVFEYPCSLLYQSFENFIGLQPVIAWRPTGSIIATVIWTTKRCQLAIFEKKCLLRWSYNLKEKEFVEQLKWCPSGEILAILRTIEKSQKRHIDLCTIKNNVFYLKQRLEFDARNPLIFFEFLNHEPFHYLRATTINSAVQYAFKFNYNCSPVYKNVSSVLCASINGSKALISSAKSGLMPPPMFETEAPADCPINFVLFHPEKPHVGVIDCNNVITIYEIENNEAKKLERFSFIAEQNNVLVPLSYHHFLWDNEKIICFREYDNQDNSTEVGSFRTNKQWSVLNDFNINGKVNYLGFIRNTTNLIAQIDKQIVHITEEKTISILLNLPVLPLYIQAVSIDDKTFVFTMTEYHQFFVNDQEIIERINSFIIFDNYLLIGSAENKLIVIRLEVPALNNFYNRKFEHIFFRTLELGAFLITGIPNTSSILVQMHRGNLEICACRLIMIDIIQSFLDKLDFKNAYELVRIQRLNTNVIIDFDFTRFISNIELFINSLSSPLVLNEFIIGLQNENVLNSLYRNCCLKTFDEIPNKLEKVCAAILKHLTEKLYIPYISSVVTVCFIKDRENAIVNTLPYIQNILRQIKTNRDAVNVAVEALDTLVLLKPTGNIFLIALQTYDLDLALFVARNTNMNPSEFQPLFTEFRSVSPIECRYKINYYLGQYLAAFKYMIKCSNFNDDNVFEYIQRHNIAKQSLWYLIPNTPLYAKVTKVVAQEYSKTKKFDESGLLYERLGLYPQALEEYKQGLYWKEAVNVMRRIQTPFIGYNDYFQDIIKELKKLERVVEAVEIIATCLNDHKSAVDLCMSEKLFTEAYQLILKHNLLDSYAAILVENISNACGKIKEELLLVEKDFLKHKSRLIALRNEKKEQYLKIPDSENYEIDEIGSIAGTSTVASMRTSSSRGKGNIRNRERKKHSLRIGGPYEDIALLEILHKSIRRVFDWGPKIREISLIVLKMTHTIPPNVVSVYHFLSNLQDLMKASLIAIWPPNLNNVNREPVDVSIYENLNILDNVYRVQPDNIELPWKIESFPHNN